MEGMAPGPSEVAEDFSRPAPFVRDLDVIFICVDVEWWEISPHPVTEIGVSILDTRDLTGVAPGPDGHGWFDKIRSRHFRIAEHKDKVNRVHIHGCPDRFEPGFGATEELGLREAVDALAVCFRSPFTGPEIDELTRRRLHPPRRPVMYVGHDPKGDLGVLDKVGFKMTHAPPHILETMDTAAIYGAYKLGDNTESSPSVAKMLYSLGITGWNLHNAVSLLESWAQP